ncbi:MAG: hypothetical protein QOF98_228 [Streptomyces sp.]|nr:hypothetical protein [Streptomyces sp.]
MFRRWLTSKGRQAWLAWLAGLAWLTHVLRLVRLLRLAWLAGLPRLPVAARLTRLARRAGLPRLTRKLRPRYPRPGRRGPLRWLPSLRQTLLLGTWLLLALTALIGYAYERTAIPKDLNAFATQQDNVYYWADGTEMARVGPIDRQAMPLDRIPSSVQWAVLSAENANFYQDSGISPKGLARAVTAMATGGDV